MGTKERIITIRLMEKLQANPACEKAFTTKICDIQAIAADEKEQ